MFLNKKNIQSLVLLIFLVSIGGMIFISRKDNAFEKHATAILKICEKETYHPACYDREIPKLMDKGLSMEDAFAVTRLIQEKDNYPYL